MPEYRFDIALSTAETRTIYAGRARYIIVEADTGIRLQLPAANFRRFVDRDGIHGRFRVRVSDDNRITGLDRF